MFNLIISSLQDHRGVNSSRRRDRLGSTGGPTLADIFVYLERFVKIGEVDKMKKIAFRKSISDRRQLGATGNRGQGELCLQ
jgi:hypothetical protein